MVGFAPSARSSTSRARTASARVMSADIEIWNAGACHASVIRRATVRRRELSSTTSTSPGASATAAVGAGAAAARSTSSATMRPSGPVPVKLVSSIPRSRAIRRASGEALTLSPSRRSSLATVCCKVSDGGDSRFASGFAAASGAGVSSGTDSPCSPITAIVFPTSTSPSEIAILSSTPDASASTSWVTLSVSSS